MPNVAAVLKEEITRLARKEVRHQVDPLKKVIAEQRRSIAELKRRLADIQRGQGFLEKQEKRRLVKPAPAAAESEGGDTPRFSPKWVAADRKRLGLSANDYSKLVGVSMLTIYNWEKGKTKPQARQLNAWANVRGIGKREALRRLELLEG